MRLLITLLALAAAGASIGCSDSTAQPPLDSGLSDGGAGDANPVVLTIQPTSLSLGPGRTQLFVANVPVTWSVSETNGGQIDAGGTYTAPATLGTYHVSATTPALPGQVATATILVDGRQLAFIAGALGGSGRADDVGSAARFNSPEQLAYDGNGQLYVADKKNNTIRKVDVASGAVTTVAGAPGQPGTSDGIGSAARFYWPAGLALDGSGGLLVSEEVNHTIRRVDLATRAVTTVSGIAGTPGSANGATPTYSQPLGLAYDPAGLLYIADSGNGLVRRLDLKTGVAGTVSGAFSIPIGLAYDGSQYLYVSDGRQLSISRIDVTGGPPVQVAGGPAGFLDGAGGHFSNPAQLALDGSVLRVADLRLRTVELTDGAVSTQAGGGFGIGPGLAIDEHGRTLFVTGDAIARVDGAGNGYSIVAGGSDATGYVEGTGAIARFDEPRGLAYDGQGALYVTDVQNAAVRKVVVSSAQVSTLAGSPWLTVTDGVGARGRMRFPERLAADRNGTVLIVESDSSVIRKWVVSTNTLTTLAGSFGLDGNADGVGPAARFYTPGGACVDSGALYLADTGNDTVRKLDIATGTVTTIAGSAEQAGAVDDTGAAARFRRLTDVACDGAGHLYVADADNHAIRRITLANNAVDTVAGKLGLAGSTDALGGLARFNGPSYLALAGAYLYVADEATSSVRQVRLSDFNVTTLAAQLPGTNLTGLAADDGGTVYVSDRDLTIRSIAAGGAVSLLAGGTTNLPVDGQGAAAGFSSPSGLVFNGTALFVAEIAGSSVRRIDLPGGNVTTVLGVGAYNAMLVGLGPDANILRPHAIVFDGAALLVGDDDGHTIDRIDPATGALTIVAGAALHGGWDDGPLTTAHLLNVAGLALDSSASLYFSDSVGDTFRTVAGARLDTLAGMTSAGSGSKGSTDAIGAAARFNVPEGIALDGAGNAYVADSFNHVIRKIELSSGTVTTPFGTAGMQGALDGQGAQARFALPLDLLYEAPGVLYVADSGNGAIRRIDLSSGMVTTYIGLLGQQGVSPGPLPARLNRPRGLVKLGPDQLGFIDEQGIFVVR